MNWMEQINLHKAPCIHSIYTIPPFHLDWTKLFGEDSWLPLSQLCTVLSTLPSLSARFLLPHASVPSSACSLESLSFTAWASC